MEAGGCSFTADVQADYGDRVYGFTMACRYEGGEAQMEILAPDAIAGISAKTSQGGTELRFDGAELDFGQLANGFVSPVATPWLLVQCWMEEYIAYAGADGDLERITYLRGYHEEELAVDTWFRDSIPVHAEVAQEGVRRLTVEIRNFQMIPQPVPAA